MVSNLQGRKLGTGQLCHLLKVTGWMSDDTGNVAPAITLFQHVHGPL